MMIMLNNYRDIDFFGKSGKYVLGIASLLLLFVGCQTTDTPPKKEESIAVNTAIVYGKVHFKTPQNTDNKAVLIMPYRYPCAERDSSGHNDAIPAHLNFGHIQPSGNYRVSIPIQAWTAGQPPCFKAFPVSYNSSYNPKTETNADYDSLLAAPKMMGAGSDTTFSIHLLFYGPPHLPSDSVRVDFVVNDSTRRAVKDSAK